MDELFIHRMYIQAEVRSAPMYDYSDVCTTLPPMFEGYIHPLELQCSNRHSDEYAQLYAHKKTYFTAGPDIQPAATLWKDV